MPTLSAAASRHGAGRAPSRAVGQVTARRQRRPRPAPPLSSDCAVEAGDSPGASPKQPQEARRRASEDASGREQAVQRATRQRRPARVGASPVGCRARARPPRTRAHGCAGAGRPSVAQRRGRRRRARAAWPRRPRAGPPRRAGTEASAPALIASASAFERSRIVVAALAGSSSRETTRSSSSWTAGSSSRRLQLAPHPVRGDRQHLVHQVAPAALGQRSLLLDVGPVLGQLLRPAPPRPPPGRPRS